MTPDILRFLLLAYILVSAMISLAYLGRRRLSIGEFFFWGILVLIIPIFGPFLAITFHPGPGPRTRRMRHTSVR